MNKRDDTLPPHHHMQDGKTPAQRRKELCDFLDKPSPTPPPLGPMPDLPDLANNIRDDTPTDPETDHG